MTESPSPPMRLRPLPIPFFAGLLAAIGVCTLIGHLGHRRPFKDFTRFHLYVAPETGYFPTANQVRALGLQRDPEKITVVIGGNSILYGVGQPVDQCWANRLQELLGPDYEVLNLAMRGACTYEFGGVGAEMLVNEGRKVIFVSNVAPGFAPEVPDGYVYRYLFWEAYTKGLIHRDKSQVEFMKFRMLDDPELQRRMKVDRVMRANDFWHRVTYQHFSTFYNFLLTKRFPRPRRQYKDVETPTPPAHLYPPAQDAVQLMVMRGWIDVGRDLIGEPGPTPCPQNLERALRNIFPEPLRGRSLLVVVRESPHYVRMFEPAERDRYERLFPATVEAIEKAGFEGLDVGQGFSEREYNDRCHLSVSGGKMMAESVAPKVRALAAKLGYVTDQTGR